MDKCTKDRQGKSPGIAIYLRLSRQDGDVGDGKDESNSIENQRKLILNYIDAHPDLEGSIYCYTDDGASGSDFRRPGYTRMLDDAKKLVFDTIIVKDFSRLGRDYIGVADYVERIFPLLGIRFIAINNHFDSGSASGASMDLGMALENLVNTFYLQDSVKKKRTADEIRWKQGKATSAYLPYGYYWDKKDRGKWFLDPVSSKYVRYIFDLALEGKRTGEIAAILNEGAIPTPITYNEERMNARTREEQSLLWPVPNFNKAPVEERLWTSTAVRTILKRYEYTGALVMNKHKVRKSPETGKSTRRDLPQSEHIVTEGAHEAIVTVEEFEKVQKIIQNGIEKRSPVPREYPLKGKARCGTCRRMLTYEARKRNAGYYYCAHKHMIGEMSGCCGERYSADDINARVLNAIERVISVAQVLEVKLESRSVEERGIPDPNRIETQIRVMKEERIRQYEGYADGMITRKEYLAKKQKIDGKIEKLEAELEEAEALLAEEQRIIDEIKRISNAEERISNADAMEADGGGGEAPKSKPLVLTGALVEAFIDCVYVYDPEHIEIVFKCEDVIKAAIDKTSGGGRKPHGVEPAGMEQTAL